MVEWEPLLAQVNEIAADFIPKLAGALAVLVVGWLCISWFGRFFERRLRKRRVDVSLIPFLTSLTVWGLRILLLITAAGMMGIQMTSFIAIIGAAGLAVGLALQGSLANFAGGVLILLLKPFKVGEFIEAQGQSGVVTEIHIFYTVVTTTDNKVVTIPNGQLSNEVIVNYTRNDTRRVDMTFGIGYTDDIDKARTVIETIISKNKKILKKPEHQILVSELADSSVNFATRVWCKTPDYWKVYFSMHEEVKKAFDKEGVSIPFPQMDIHLQGDVEE